MNKRSALTLEQKLQIKAFQQRNPTKAQYDILTWAENTFKVSIGRSTMQRILATPKENFSSANLNSKKKRKVCNPEFEKELVEFIQKHEDSVPLTDAVIIEKGRRLLEKHGASLSLSNGWLDKFKKRNGIRSCVLHGEEGSVNKLELEEHQRIVLSQYSPRMFSISMNQHFSIGCSQTKLLQPQN